MNMLRNFFEILFLAFFFIISADGTSAELNSNEIIAISLRNWPPEYSINAETGQPEGFAIDVMNKVAELGGLHVQYEVYDSWTDVIETIQNNKAFVIPNFGITDQRKNDFDFTVPYETLRIVIFIRSTTSDIDDISDLTGHTVGVVETNQGSVLMKKQNGCDLKIYQSMEEAFMELLSGHVDALVYPEKPIISIALKAGLEDKIKIVGQPLQEIKRGIAVSKGRPELFRKLDTSLRQLLQTSDYVDIYEKWYGTPRPFWTLTRMFVIMGMLLGLTTAGLLAWRYISLLKLNNILSKTVDELKKAEQTIRDSEAKYSDLYDNAPDMYLNFDANGTILQCNRTFITFSGYSPDDILGQPFIEIFHPDNHEAANDMFHSLVTSGEVRNAELQLKQRDGGIIFVSLNVSAIRDEAGHIVYSRAILHDISTRKQAELTIKESEERLKFVLDGSQLGFWDWDIVTGAVYRNEHWATMLGYTLQEIEYTVKQWTDLHHPEDQDAAWKSIQDHLEGRTPAHKIEYRMRTKDGQYKWILDQAKIVSRDSQGKPLRMCGTHTDITDRKKIEEQFRQAQKMEAIGTLAGGIAHDFNNMLGVITGNISFALSSVDQTDELYEILSDVLASTKHAQSLTQQLLTFSKGGVPIKTVLDINRLIKESAIFSIRGAKAYCSFDLSNDLWTADVDEGQINQVIGNLVINANQAMPNGGNITIRTENAVIKSDSSLPLPEGKYIKITIEDQGIGISQKNISKIFDPYFSTKQQGSGLGLATTYSIIKKHNGHIAVYSEIDKGTVFHIYLPASLNITEKKEEINMPSHRGQGKILIMDDQEPILKMVERMVNRMGYETVSAHDGALAIELYRDAFHSQKPFDVVILDLTVPGGIGGAETIIELQAIDPTVKAIVSSGYSNDPIMANYKDYGFCGVAQKPYTRDHLADVLNKALRGR